jgi:hypothetical protein
MPYHEISFEKMKFGLLRKLSNVLGISFEELINTQPMLSPVLSSAGMVKSYTVSFGAAPSLELQKKIKKISLDGKVHLDYYVLNEILPTGETNNANKTFHSQKITLGIIF